MAYLNYKNLSLPKLNSEPNHWADHIELFCFLSQDGYLSKQQIIDRILDENSNNPNTAINDIADEEEINELLADLIDQAPLQDEIIDGSQNNSALTDKISSKVNLIFDFLLSRQIHIEQDYPFSISSNELLLKDNISIEQKLYLALLCSSLLRLSTKFGVNKLGHLFEELCGTVFVQILPQNSSHYFFGSGNANNHHFTGTFYSKVIELCNKLHVSQSQNFTPEYAGKYNTGDGGIDWIGIFDFKDSQSSQPVFMGQCACGTSDWIDKEFDTHNSKWKNYIQFSNGYLTYHFIPAYYRDQELFWYNPLNIFDVVLIDRYRILDMLKKVSNLDDILTIYAPFFKEIEENKIDYFM